MAKGDDAVTRKRNRARRKKMRSQESVSARVASIIASKRRRKSGKRRICEGMCFTLPTLEDPFNDRNDPKVKRGKTLGSRNAPNKEGDGKSLYKCDDKKNKGSDKLVPNTNILQHEKEGLGEGGPEYCPSKFLTVCLNSIQQHTWADDTSSSDHSGMALLVSRWGFHFWRHCSGGLDILDSSGPYATFEQVAWLVSTASDIITRREKEGTFFETPFLLYIVPFQERARKVRTICKPLKELGIHTVSVHSGATIEHQVLGLKNSEPEFLISTPERLLELVSLGAVDVSKVSLLVLDGLKTLISIGSGGSIESIRSRIVTTPQTFVFTDSSGDDESDILSSLMRPSFCKLSMDSSGDGESDILSSFT